MAHTGKWDTLFDGAPIAYSDPAVVAERHSWEGGRSESGNKRLDIQGLRSVAVVLVIIYHAGVGRLSGGYIGVDVFFVISGFLITSHISRGLREGEFSLIGFYANRARRLLPAAFVTIAATCLLTYLILPATRFQSIAHDALTSALYAVNYRLANQSVDYLTANQSPSPFQHFWSLAVEEQYYLVWPLLLLIAVGFVAGKRARMMPAFVLAALAVFAASLIYSISFTDSDPSQAYFVAPTRMWELALGGVLAFGAETISRLPRAVAAPLGWVGLAAIVYSAFVFTASTPFPGSAAMAPTLGAAAVIAVGPAAGRLGPVFVLGQAVPVWLGDISYSLYLWHYPLIVMTMAQFTHAMPVWAGLLAGFGAIVPAWFSYHFIEQRALHSVLFEGKWAGLGLGFMASLASVVAALLLLTFIPESPVADVTVAQNGTAVDVQGNSVKVGAEVLSANPAGDPAGAPANTATSITPDPLQAAKDLPPLACIQPFASTVDDTCLLGDSNSTTTVELVGDSHAWQWMPALDAMVTNHHWRGMVRAKASCPLIETPIALAGKEYLACAAWNTMVIAAILQEKPSMVIVSASTYISYENGAAQTLASGNAAIENGYVSAWMPLIQRGIHIVVLANTPTPMIDIPGCVAQNTSHLTRCAVDRSTAEMTTTQELAQRAAPGVGYVNLNDAICPTNKCAAVIGSVLVYSDTNHLTATYVRSLVARFDKAFASQLKR